MPDKKSKEKIADDILHVTTLVWYQSAESGIPSGTDERAGTQHGRHVGRGHGKR